MRVRPGLAVDIYNVLPGSLAKYSSDLRKVLLAGGYSATIHSARTTEAVQGASSLRRLGNLLHFYGGAYRQRPTGLVLVVWPFFGYFDMLLWPALVGRARTTMVIVHDVPPLRRQIGSSDALSTLAARLHVRGVHLLVHDEAAAQDLRSRGWQGVDVLPHPLIFEPAVKRSSAATQQRLTVAGQYKQSRELQVLIDLGARKPDGIDLELVGAGWPQIKGWTTQPGFLSDEAFQNAIRESTALLLPYSAYSQSGVAVLAYESGTPVIGLRHPQLMALYGPDYIGYVPELTAPEVIMALARIAQTPASSWRNAVETRAAACVEQWSDYLSRFRRST
jgi:hypothetical protein